MSSQIKTTPAQKGSAQTKTKEKINNTISVSSPLSAVSVYSNVSHIVIGSDGEEHNVIINDDLHVDFGTNDFVNYNKTTGVFTFSGNGVAQFTLTYIVDSESAEGNITLRLYKNNQPVGVKSIGVLPNLVGTALYNIEYNDLDEIKITYTNAKAGISFADKIPSKALNLQIMQLADGTIFDNYYTKGEIDSLISPLTDQVNSLQLEVNTLNTESNTLQMEVETLQNQVGTLETNVSTLQTEVDAHESELLEGNSTMFILGYTGEFGLCDWLPLPENNFIDYFFSVNTLGDKSIKNFTPYQEGDRVLTVQLRSGETHMKFSGNVIVVVDGERVPDSTPYEFGIRIVDVVTEEIVGEIVASGVTIDAFANWDIETKLDLSKYSGQQVFILYKNSHDAIKADPLYTLDVLANKDQGSCYLISFSKKYLGKNT